MKPNIERRFFQVLEFRAEGEAGSRRLTGHAAVFDQLSEDLGGWFERIAKGAFTDAIATSDVRSLFNHDANLILGRTSAKTLAVAEDERGLAYDNLLPNTSYANDLLVSVDRGDVREMSFGMTVAEDQWITEGDKVVRVITRVSRLWDVSPVTFPAYPATDVATRAAFTAFQESRKDQVVHEIDRLRTDLAALD